MLVSLAEPTRTELVVSLALKKNGSVLKTAFVFNHDSRFTLFQEVPLLIFNPFMLNVFPILISWTRQFQILGLLGVIFHFYQNVERRFCKQTVENLVLHRLPMSHKKDGMVIWVKNG